jgi:hypothetical protein
LIELPKTYPQQSPSVGFATSFPYNMGASKTISDGRLKGLFTLCLNILSNFEEYHTEWKTSVGEGWSAVIIIIIKNENENNIN